jgi:hypothetical protein
MLLVSLGSVASIESCLVLALRIVIVLKQRLCHDARMTSDFHKITWYYYSCTELPMEIYLFVFTCGVLVVSSSGNCVFKFDVTVLQNHRQTDASSTKLLSGLMGS